MTAVIAPISKQCPKCVKGTLHIDPLDGDTTCVNCGYILSVVLNISAGVPTSQLKETKLSYYLTEFFQREGSP